MKAIKIGLSLFLICFITLADAQVLTSKKSYLKLNQEPEATKEEPVKSAPARLETRSIDNTPPEITLVSHEISRDNTIETTDPEMVLIGKVSDDSEISSLFINTKMVSISKKGIFTAPVELTPGSNEVVLLAVDAQDNFKNLKFTVNYAPVKQTLAETVSSESEYYALIIGINNYPDPAINSLDNPIRDAEELQKVLVSNYNFDKDKIQFLKDAKREDIINSLDYLSHEVNPTDNLLIFYAGHGYWDETANIGYWLPSDARRISKAAWFRNSTLVDYLKEINTKHTLLITDACFGGSIFQTRSAFADTPKAIEMLYELPSRKAMTSGQLTEVPDESSFSKFLISRLATNKEEYMSSATLFNSLREAVMNNSDAIPAYGEIRNVGDQGGDFIFIKK